MYDSIQPTNTTSSVRTSQVTWPNDNRAVGNCLHALLAGFRPASLILARRIAFPLVLLGAGLVLVQHRNDERVVLGLPRFLGR